MNNYILGVDSGGTKTVAQIASINGEVITEAGSGSGNYKSIGLERAKENITKAVLRAIKNLKVSNNLVFRNACFGLSGNDTEEDEKIYKKIIFNNELIKYLNPSKTIICNDTKIGLVAGTDNKNGIIIICGTGSNCYGINENGMETKANGWDYILGDEGSGYKIGIKALRAIMRAYDGRGDSTLLSKTLFEDLNIKSISELMKWAYSGSFSKDKISALAMTVCRTAEINDKVSKKILIEEANEDFISIRAVARKLDLENKEFDLVFVGSVFKCEKYFKKVLIKKLREKFPKINFINLSKKPVEGAIKLAIKNL